MVDRNYRPAHLVLEMDEGELKAIADANCKCYGTGREGYVVGPKGLRIPKMCKCVKKAIERGIREAKVVVAGVEIDQATKETAEGIAAIMHGDKKPEGLPGA